MRLAIRQRTELVSADGRAGTATLVADRVEWVVAALVRFRLHEPEYGRKIGKHEFWKGGHRRRSIVRARTERSLSKIAHSSRPHSSKGAITASCALRRAP